MTPVQMRAPAPVRVVFTGQSRNNTPDPPFNVPPVLMHGLGVPWVNLSISGNGWYDLMNNAAHLAALRAQARAGNDILSMWGGEGDLWNTAPSGQQTGGVAYTRAIAYRDLAASYGFNKFLIVATPSAGPNVLGTGRPTVSEQTQTVLYQNLILANSGGFDAVVDIANSDLGDTTNLTYYHADRTHFVAAGAARAAELIRPTLVDLINSF